MNSKNNKSTIQTRLNQNRALLGHSSKKEAKFPHKMSIYLKDEDYI
jgi:hypothetical protein